MTRRTPTSPAVADPREGLAVVERFERMLRLVRRDDGHLFDVAFSRKEADIVAAILRAHLRTHPTEAGSRAVPGRELTRLQMLQAIEPKLQAWIDWCGTNDETPEAGSGARIAVDALATLFAAPQPEPAGDGLVELIRGFAIMAKENGFARLGAADLNAFADRIEALKREKADLADWKAAAVEALNAAADWHDRQHKAASKQPDRDMWMQNEHRTEEDALRAAAALVHGEDGHGSA